MFMATVGRHGEAGTEVVDVFQYYLAEKLGKTVAELQDMPAAEYSRWQSYYKVKEQAEDLAGKVASRGR